MGKKSRKDKKKMTEEEKKERHDRYYDMIRKKEKEKRESESFSELLNDYSKREDEKWKQEKKFLCKGTIDINLDLSEVLSKIIS